MSDADIQLDTLTISVAKSATRATIAWKGTSDSRNPGAALNPALERLVQSVESFDVTVDFTELEYMNSATIAPLMELIRKLDTSCKSVQVVFLDAGWQCTHYRCMSAIARTLKHVTVVSRSPQQPDSMRTTR